MHPLSNKVSGNGSTPRCSTDIESHFDFPRNMGRSETTMFGRKKLYLAGLFAVCLVAGLASLAHTESGK